MDVKDKNFANKVILASSKTDLSHTITVSDLNSKIMTLLKVYEMEQHYINLIFLYFFYFISSDIVFHFNPITIFISFFFFFSGH